MGFAWTRNFYAISIPRKTMSGIDDFKEFCFESKKSRDSAVKFFNLMPIKAKEVKSYCDVVRVTDVAYRRIKAKYLFYHDGNRDLAFEREFS